MTSKQERLRLFIEKHKDLPEQRSEQWLKDRKFNIGGSEMSVMTGQSPYKTVRGLIEQHLGITVFKGNINTYWGSILEDFVTDILEKKWGVDIPELGSLPGVIDNQKYSPDGLVYLDFLKCVVLLEIKNAARRLTTGSVPTMYKPQVFTGMDTIQVADVALFVDVCFRRCTPEQFFFDPRYDYTFHGKKTVEDPIALCMLSFYISNDSANFIEANRVCDVIKDHNGHSQDEYIDLGSCKTGELEAVMKLATTGIVNVEFSPLYEIPTTFTTLADEVELRHAEKKSTVLGVMPVKMFKFNIKPMRRHDWRKMRKLKGETGDSYVRIYEEKINETIPDVPKEMEDDLIASMI
jgi:hypothetical protein